MTKPIRILLASHNGEKYLPPMIDSILAQDEPDFQLILSDDGSADGSEAILGAYARRHPDKILHYRAGIRFGSAQKHFLHLLQTFPDGGYTMFCDQDDVWHPDKLRKSRALMERTEGAEEAPTLIHTDLKVVDESLKEIAPSFCRYSGLDGRRMQLNRLLVQNVVTGCTVMINRALVSLACTAQPSDAVVMHDWWLALLAAACGRTAFLPEPTVDYRQHGANTVGARNVYAPEYLRHRIASKSGAESLRAAARQAAEFARCYEPFLSAQQRELLCAFSESRNLPLLKRDWIYLKHGLLKQGAARVAAQLLGW